MADALGIELHPDVLPFSNIPAYLPPFLLRPGSGDDAGRVTRRRTGGRRRRPDAGDAALLTIDPVVGGRFASLVVGGHELLVTEG